MRLEKILVVDDEPEVLNVLSKMLVEKGYKPIPCKNGLEAMKLIEKERFYIGLLDIMLPDMDGLEILKETKKKNPLAELIVITGHESMDIAIKAIKYQACDFLVKPINFDLLYNSVKRAEEMASLRLKNLLQTRSLERAVKKKTKQLIQAEKQAIIGSSVQGVIHNVINPLTVISGKAELLKSELDDIKQKGAITHEARIAMPHACPDALQTLGEIDAQLIDKIGQDINIICQNSQKIFQIVDNILKKSLKEQQNTPSRIDINSLIMQDMEFFKSDLYFKHQVKASYHLDPSLGEVNMVYSHLSQVFDNLVKNAIDAMYDSPDKEITISTYQDDEYVFISINDTGNGIPPHLKDKIFEQFFTTKKPKEDSKSKQRIGAGLGLHTCLELLRPYGGEIQVESQLGNGSTFKIVLPHSLTCFDKTNGKTNKPNNRLQNKDEKVEGVLARHLC